MKKPWSLSTTVRNPERIISFLHTLKKIEGKKFDSDMQKHFQILLIQNKHYRPSNMTDKQNNYFENPEPMTFDQATEIFNSKKYVDPSMRGRQSFAILKKMGLCLGSSSDAIRITELGNTLLLPTNDMGDTFFNFFLKWQFPNPIDTKFSEKEGFMIIPFLGTLHLIHKVNLLWKEEGKRPVGISKKEFALFVPTLINYKDIEMQAYKIIEFRKKSKTGKITYQNKFLKLFLGDDSPEKMKQLYVNLKDYGDNAIRYFRLTRYIQIRGNGFFVDLEPRRMIEISALLRSYTAIPADISKVNDYIEYLSDKHQPKLPWQSQTMLLKINRFLQMEISKGVKSLETFQIRIPKIQNLNKLSLKEQNKILKAHLLELQNMQQYHDMGKSASITECIEQLTDIRKTENKPSVELEKQTALSLMALNDAIKIKPNYPIGDDGNPTFTAPGGVSDLECYYKQFNLICEVTLLTNRTQWYYEGQPVMRHLRDFETSNADKATYCLFVAPKIHEDTANTFWNAVKYEYRGKPQKIIPMRIDLLVKLLKVLQIYKDKNNIVIPHTKLMNLYDNIINLVCKVDSSDAWIREIPNEINRWERCLLV